jgi:hypothetical protein
MLQVPSPHESPEQWTAFLDEVEALLNCSTPLMPEQFVSLARIWSAAVPVLAALRHELDRMKESRHRHRPDEEPASLEAIRQLEKRYSRLADIQQRCLIFSRTAFPHSPNHFNPDPIGDTALAITRKEKPQSA